MKEKNVSCSDFDIHKGIFHYLDCKSDEKTSSATFRYTYKEYDKEKPFYFKLSKVNMNIAVLSFIDYGNNQEIIVPPANFILTANNGVNILPFQNQFFITWAENYQLTHFGDVIWELITQKQQSILFDERKGVSSI